MPISDSLIGRTKAANDACQAELRKTNKMLDKWQNINEKTREKEEGMMRRHLEKLEQDRMKYSEMCGYTVHELLHGRKKSSSTMFPSVDPGKDRQLMTTAKSHRQLRLEYSSPSPAATPRSFHAYQFPHDSGTQEKHPMEKRRFFSNNSDRRKSMPAGHASTSQWPKTQDTNPKRHSISGPVVPRIMVTDHDTSEADDRHEPARPTHPKGQQNTGVHPESERNHSDDHHGHQSNKSTGSLHRHDNVHPDTRSSDSLQSRHSNTQPRGERSMDSVHQDVNNLFDLAIQTVASANEFMFTRSSSTSNSTQRRPSVDESKVPDLHQLDLSALKELEGLLKESLNYREKKQREGDYGLHTAENRIHKRRLHFLEEILQCLSRDDRGHIEPEEILNCSYLRLSKSNIETLEEMIRDKGHDPGIHAHFNVTDYDLFKDLRAEKGGTSKMADNSPRTIERKCSKEAKKHKTVGFTQGH